MKKTINADKPTVADAKSNGSGNGSHSSRPAAKKTPAPGRSMTFEEALADVRDKHAECIRELAK